MNKIIEEWMYGYPRFKECSIQTFNEQDKSEKAYSKILPVTRENLERCEKLQLEHPYGVYFSVNPMQKGKRDKASVTMIQTRICDIDEGTKEEQIKLINDAPIKPTLVVESVHGFHLYYIAMDGITQEEYENGNRGLKNYYHGDAKICKDTARVLRIPGFYHQKGEKVMVVFREDLSCGMLYTVEEMNTAFPNQTETTPGREKQRTQFNKQLDESDTFRGKASKLNNKMMLSEFSGTQRVSGDVIDFKRNTNGTEQIYVNGKSTGCWLDDHGMIGSGDKGGPTRIQRLKRYGLVNWKELARYLKDKGYIEEERTQETLDLHKLMQTSGIAELRKPDFTRGDTGIDDAIGKLAKGQLVILLGETGAGKTTFATFMARKNQDACYFVLEDSVDNIARRYATKRAGITKKELNQGNRGKDKQELYELAYQRFKEKEIHFVDVGHKIQVSTLIETMKQLKKEGFTMFFIDNLGYVVGDGTGETEQTADISSRLVSFCLQEDVCVVLLHHFKKGKSGDRDISQMRGSGKLGDDAFLVVKYVRDDPQTFLQVYKDRTRGDLKTYEIIYDRGDYKYLGVLD